MPYCDGRSGAAFPTLVTMLSKFPNRTSPGLVIFRLVTLMVVLLHTAGSFGVRLAVPCKLLAGRSGAVR